MRDNTDKKMNFICLFSLETLLFNYIAVAVLYYKYWTWVKGQCQNFA